MKTSTILSLFLAATLLASVFLASCDREEMTSPVALFDVQTPPRYMFKVNLDASESFSTLRGDYLEYRWDLNGDHLEWETYWINNPVLTVQFPFISSGYIGLQVKNKNGDITELYQGFYTREDYTIQNAFSDLEIDFRKLTYRFSEPGYHWSWIWAYDNIQLPESDAWYNFSAGADRAAYGSLMTWNVADTLEKNYYLPTRADWQKMIDYSGKVGLAGFNLQVKAEHGLQLSCPGIVNSGQLQENGQTGYYWTGDEADANSAWALKIMTYSDLAEFVILDKSSLASVRLMNEHFQYYK